MCVYFVFQEKLDRLYDLDRMIQEQSFQVTSLKEDRVSHSIVSDQVYTHVSLLGSVAQFIKCLH